MELKHNINKNGPNFPDLNKIKEQVIGKEYNKKKIVDFHVHVFPDKIADKTIKNLAKLSGTTPYTNGTKAELISSMEKSGVDVSLVLPIVTNPEKARHINQLAADMNKDFDKTGICSIGGINPDNKDYKDILKEIKELGLKGVKLHPDYYGVRLDDIRLERIIDEASSLGLFIITHAGPDIGLYPPALSPVDSIVKVINDVKPEKFILAHMGGWMAWDEALAKLRETNVYLDTSFSIGEINWSGVSKVRYGFHMMEDDMFVKMVRAFGSERILFATDSPWSDQADYIDRISKMPLTEEEKDNIFYKNAYKLLEL